MVKSKTSFKYLNLTNCNHRVNCRIMHKQLYMHMQRIYASTRIHHIAINKENMLYSRLYCTDQLLNKTFRVLKYLSFRMRTQK